MVKCVPVFKRISLISGRLNLCRVFMPSTSFLLGYLTSSLQRWSSPASELLTVCYPVTAVSMCCMLWGEKGEILVYFFQYEMAWLMWTGPPAKGKPNCLSSHLLECRWAGRTAIQHELWASPCALRHQRYEPAPRSTSEFSLVSSPCACSRGQEAIAAPSSAVSGERCTGRAVHGPCPGTSGSLYATCTVFCHAEELFIIYCITAVEIYFAIRGGKKK